MNIPFEEAMKKLEEILEKLDANDVPLEEAIEIYKEGMELSKHCHDKLKAVEEQIETLIEKSGKIEKEKIEFDDLGE
jgi:exodeoxyribonuclease VII small subunit